MSGGGVRRRSTEETLRTLVGRARRVVGCPGTWSRKRKGPFTVDLGQGNRSEFRHHWQGSSVEDGPATGSRLYSWVFQVADQERRGPRRSTTVCLR